MVELEPVSEEEALMQKLHHHGGDLEWHGRVDISGDMTKHDDERLHQLISNHLHYTGSDRAKSILDHWDEMRPKFVKVMPVEYRRASKAMEKTPAPGSKGVAAEEVESLGVVLLFGTLSQNALW